MSELWDNQPPAPTCERAIEIEVVGKRCVYVNNYRVAGGKPYYTENLPSHTLRCSLGDVLNAFPSDDIAKALAEQEARRKYFADAHAKLKAENPS